jgi:hypothetical protein
MVHPCTTFCDKTLENGASTALTPLKHFLKALQQQKIRMYIMIYSQFKNHTHKPCGQGLHTTPAYLHPSMPGE